MKKQSSRLKCKRCGGTGFVRIAIPSVNGNMSLEVVKCPLCGGSGKDKEIKMKKD